ncbi:dienelactone hydrolase family protein [Teichococcus aestuarii]|uniref:dienelactone hydrolase family protein n=1 Tax=Teichococcus aestuarii TaxID=568898 RepID=UPI00360FA153
MRRLFLSLLLPLLALAPPAARAVELRPVTLPGPEGTPLRALLALPPAGAPLGVPVVALHGCGGIGAAGAALRAPARERDWAARLVEAGHPVLFPDSFGSRGLGPACGRPEHPARPDPVRAADALAAAAWAQAQSWAAPGGVLLLGWSHGGSTVLAAAARAEPGLVRAAVAFYPGCLAARRAGTMAAIPLLLLLGEADDWTPARFCQGWAAAQPPGRVEAVLYPGAGHGFDAPGEAPPRALELPDGRRVTAGAHPAARSLAMPRALAFLAAHAGPASRP